MEKAPGVPINLKGEELMWGKIKKVLFNVLSPILEPVLFVCSIFFWVLISIFAGIFLLVTDALLLLAELFGLSKE